jgi:hypothetical protein
MLAVAVALVTAAEPPEASAVAALAGLIAREELRVQPTRAAAVAAPQLAPAAREVAVSL